MILRLALSISIGFGAFSLHAAPRSWFAAPDVTFVSPDSGLFSGDDWSLGIAAGMVVSPNFELEAHLSAYDLVQRTSGLLVERRQLTFGPRFRIGDPSYPTYLSLSLGAADLETREDSEIAPVASIGLEYRWPLGLTGMSVGPEIRAQYTRTELSGMDKADQLDTLALVRLIYMPNQYTEQLPIISKPPSPAPTAPETVQHSLELSCKDNASDVSCRAAHDKDRDGIHDGTDRCPNTVPGVAVDPDGCML